MKFKKEEFILPTAFPCTNQLLLSDTDAPNDLKTNFDSTRTVLEKADKVPASDKIKASFDTQIGKIKNASINIKSLMAAHEKSFLPYFL